MPTETNRKPLAAIDKIPNAIGKLMMGKTLASSEEEITKITNVMVGNDVLAIHWKVLVNLLCKALGSHIGNN